MKEMKENLGGRLETEEETEETTLKVQEEGASSPDIDEMADFGFGQTSTHDTAFLRAARQVKSYYR